MFPDFSSFQVETKKLKYTTEDGIRFPQTAIITFQSKDGFQSIVELMGYMEPDQIYEKIERGEDLNLDHCYIDNLSLPDYRRQHNIPKREFIKIRNFSAKNAFFNSLATVDLSFAEFDGDGFSFEHACFARGGLSMSGAKFAPGTLDFSYMLFMGNHLDLTNIQADNGEITFKNAVFLNCTKDFQDADFGSGPINFVNTEFGDGDISFINARFGDGNVSFKVARFGEGRIDYHFAKFGQGDISFERTEFGNGKVDFRTVEFGEGRINFNRAVFGHGDVSFEASELNQGKVSFKRTIFGDGDLSFELTVYSKSDVSFDRADFNKGNISFYNGRFNTLSLKSCHLDDYVDLRIPRCKLIDLSDTIVRDIIDLKPYEFDLDIDVINFSGMRLLGRIYIDWNLNRVKKLVYSQDDTTIGSKAEQFRILKENFNVTGQYNDEDRSYVEFKRLESRHILRESLKNKPVSAIWMYPLFWFKLLVFDLAGLYATNPVRVIISMLTSYSFFSLIFVFLIYFTSTDIVSSVGDPDKLSVFARSFYHSAITFLTIGYGDFYPSGAIRWISGIEGFIGLFLMSYFTVAFVRKILR